MSTAENSLYRDKKTDSRERKIGKPRQGMDRFLFVVIVLTVLFGFLIFMSAALGLYARDGATFASVMQTQALGVAMGFIALMLGSVIPYSFWKKAALPLFIVSVVLMLIVVMPGIGFLHGGSRRWIYVGSLSFQPADLFKITLVMLYARWIVKHRTLIHQFTHAVLPLGTLLGIAAFLLALQPKFGTLVVVVSALLSMFIISGARLKHILFLFFVALPFFVALMFSFPYVRDRVDTFLNPAVDPLGEGYQIEQSLIAIGSGGGFGRGYGQSIQKFNFLPEPIGDSIFAVAAEELGFLGSTTIVLLIVLFTYRALVIAAKAPDHFARLLVLGLVILITAQSFIHIAAMVGLFPLSGMPLVFISHGGTAMVTALGSVGIILNVSKYSKL
ncbi:MAG: FtsW/RodA/SpoVE family cell cycle protein [Candidatus Paceibacterota bacterium]